MIYILQQNTPDAIAGDKYYLQDDIYIHEDVINNPLKIMVSYPKTIVENTPLFFLPEVPFITEIVKEDDTYKFTANSSETFSKTTTELYTLLKN